MSHQFGTRIGPRLVELISSGIAATHKKLLGTKHKLAMAIFNSISDEISDEVDITLGPILRKLHETTPQDHPAYPALNFMYTASGQLKALAGQGLTMSGLLSAISTIINNELAPVVYNIVASNPHSVPDVGTLATLAAKGIVSEQDAVGAMNGLGFDTVWAKRLIGAASSWPSIADATRLYLRNIINQDQFLQYAKLNGVNDADARQYLEAAHVPVSPADAALAYLRSNMTREQAVTAAGEWGIDESNFDILVGNTGEPPGTMQLLEAYRRGFIDKQRLVHGILQSRVRDEWVDVIEKLRYSPMTVADAVNATVQGHMSMADMAKIAEENGLEPGMVETLYQTAGSPLSRTEAEFLYNRGLMSEAEVKQALRESRIKDKYVDLAFELHTKVIPIYTLQRSIEYGAISHADAVRAVMENGYTAQDAATIVASGSLQRIQTYKRQVVSAITTLMEDNAISEQEGANLIVGLGFDKTEADFIVQAGALRRESKDMNIAINAIKSKYLERHITENEASGALDSIGVPSAQRDYLIRLWKIMWKTYTKSLTEAQTVKAVVDGLITPQDGLARLVYMGYSETDANLLLKGA